MMMRIGQWAVMFLAGVSPFGVLRGAEEVKIKKAPGVHAKWTLTVREEEKSRAEERREREGAAESEIALEGGDGGREVRKTEYELTGETGRAVTREADGRKKEIFVHRHKKNVLMLTEDASGRVRPYLLDEYALPEMRFTVSYPGVDWVKPEFFKEVVEFSGKRCFRFEQAAGTGEKGPVNEDNAAAFDNRRSESGREAWFEVATGLPVAFREGGVKGRFSHQKPSRTPIKFPKGVADAVKYYYGAGPRPK